MPDREFQYSEEAQEILGKIPNWIIRWGVTLIFIIFIGVIIGCYFIKFPQTVIAPVIITTVNPPANLMSRSTGRIDRIFVKDGNIVSKNSIIALLYNTADYKAVCEIRDSLTSTNMLSSTWIDQEYVLGEIQTYYLEFKRVYLDYRHYLTTDNIRKKKQLIKNQIIKNREYYNKQLLQKSTLDKDVYYENKNRERDSILYGKNVISMFDYEQSIRSMLQKQSTKESFDAQLTASELNILQMEQQLVELSIEQENQIAEYKRQLNHAKQQLITQIEQWRYQYLIISPIEGKITFTKYWSTNQTIQNNERIASVVPTDSMQIICRMTVPTSGFGRVKIAQTVNIKLNGYPNMEYGMLKGQISSISDVPEENGYIVEITLPKGLVSTYGKRINLIQQMDGTGDIITQDQRLIQRFLQPIRALFDK